MKSRIKSNFELFVNYINYDEYRSAPGGTEISFDASCDVSNYFISKDLNKVIVKLVSTISGFKKNDKKQNFNFSLRTSVIVHLKETLETELDSPKISEDLKKEISEFVIIKNNQYINNFLKHTSCSKLTI